MRLRLLQLPVPPPAALAATGNVPLAAGSLAVAAEVHGLTPALDVEVVAPEVTDSLGDAQLAEHVARDEPEFVGLSLYLWNVERSLHLAEQIKARSPKTRVLVGGPEVTTEPGFVHGRGGFDIAVAGEAEDRFAVLMRRLLDGGDPGEIAGVAVRGADGRLGPFGSAPTPAFELARYPSPYLTGALPVDPARSTYVETVRGCASKCTYCFYPKSSGGALRTLDAEAAGGLLAALRGRGAREVVFLDPTFNHRADLPDLLAAITRANPDRQMSMFGEVRPEGITPALARQLAEAGFTKLELGLQSVNVETLRVVQRFGRPEKVAEAAAMLRDAGIDLLVDLIVGLPNDTPDDVLRGVDFLLEHDLARFAQVFPLCILPGTAMRASAAAFGLEYDPAPPYRVLRTPRFDADSLRETLFSAEEALDRRLDETPRLHLCEPDPALADVLHVDLDRAEVPPAATAPAARHVALWFRGADLFGRRDVIRAVLDARLRVDPFAVLDVVLAPTAEPFPLDLVELIRSWLDAGPQSYHARALAHRGEDLQRRLGVVLGAAQRMPHDWIEGLLDEVPVFADQPWQQAAGNAIALGDVLPGARVLDAEVPEAAWATLRRLADPEAVVFAARDLERRWQAHSLRYA